MDESLALARTLSYDELELEPFHRLPPDLWSEDFFVLGEDVEAYVDLQVHVLLAELGCPRGVGLADEARSADMARVVGERRDSWHWLLARAAQSPWVLEASTAEQGPQKLLAALRDRLLRQYPTIDRALEMIDLAATIYPEFLRGGTTGDQVLFRSERREMWERYFDNDNPTYGPINRLTSFAARSLLDDVDGRVPQVLEVGAGCGSASEAFLRTWKEHTFHYLVTDLSPTFLRMARERVEAIELAESASVKLRLLDLTQPVEDWCVQPGSFDAVIAINVLHALPCLSESLAHLRALLRPGGQLVLGECVRPGGERSPHAEFIFQLIDAFRDVQLEPPHRGRWGFLDGGSWRKIIEGAGFVDIRSVPDYDAAIASYPAHSLAAIIARNGVS